MRAAALVFVAGMSAFVGCSAPADDDPSMNQPTGHSPVGSSDEDQTTAPATTAPPTTAPATTALATTDAYEAVVDTSDGSVPQELVDDVVDVFQRTYGTMALRFDPNAPHSVKLVFDPDYDGVAKAGNGMITFSSVYMKGHPKDLDVVTHEGFHIVQAYDHYTAPGCPAWAVEGFADYARYRYGVKNEEGGWSLPEVSSDQAPRDSYRVTGRFLVWLENRVNPSIIMELHEVLKANTYSDAFWITQTKKSIDSLWSAYSKSSGIDVVEGDDCVADKTYCGGDTVFGASDIVYRCNGSGTATETQKCKAGCDAGACR